MSLEFWICNVLRQIELSLRDELARTRATNYSTMEALAARLEVEQCEVLVAQERGNPGETWLIHMCDVTRLIDVCDMTRSAGLIYVCDITHAYVWHDSFIFVTWLIHMCDMTDSAEILGRHNSFICVKWLDWMVCATWLRAQDLFKVVTWLMHMCDMTHSHVWHDWFTCVTWLTAQKS